MIVRTFVATFALLSAATASAAIQSLSEAIQQIAPPSESQTSHSIVGLSSVVYPSTSTSEAARAALELKIGEEHVHLNMATSTVNFLVVRDIFFTSNIYDNFRIVTAATVVPEPTALAVVGCGLVFMIAQRRRQ
jgi:hypothetical protein